ncbi:DUF2520 domain-containing protein [Ornithinimicrobium tianjinense]|uniref:DUF2520 domain-containing protein n=1 Tax=Ornithinimicrobium tianjinense TaxID=1195761 RepID=A0A917BGT8_9MICO|nr:DUF2520 domain-containing protein [Ornithinimicrobium tianjinense]GGF39228.1 hypothetical protein GCM10011366_03570 [Ornithinimicrobium tianjinense]
MDRTGVRPRVAVVGGGRLGTTLTRALRLAGWSVTGPLGRGADPQEVGVVLLVVPDAQVAHASAALTPRDGLLVGHCSGATTLDVLAPHEAFSLHPLMTVTGQGADLTGATAAVAGSTDRALELAEQLADALGMLTVHVRDADRAAYHAAASVASNFLLTLEDLAERLAASAGVPRERLLPLVRATVESWARTGSASALTGPVARGDEETVARQRAAVAERCPDDLELYDVLLTRTRRLAAQEAPR